MTPLTHSDPSPAVAHGNPSGPPPPLLSVERLRVTFDMGAAQVEAVREVSFSVRPGEVLGIAGESGSGKTATALAVMGLLAHNARTSGSIRYAGTEIRSLPDRELRAIRGREIAMVFQETVTALNPVLRIGDQLLGAVGAHYREPKRELLRRVRDGLDSVQLHDVDRVLRSYPAELSGGMCQRVMIAMALSCGSKLLIADEPTTALDVSVQAEILALIKKVVAERGLAVILISHDLAVLNEVCDRLVLMYRGDVVESGPTGSVLRSPRHPYTAGLLACLPRLSDRGRELPELLGLTGAVDPTACLFRGRCPFAAEVCAKHPSLDLVELEDGPRSVRCWRQQEIAEHSWMAGAWAAAGRGDD